MGRQRLIEKVRAVTSGATARNGSLSLPIAPTAGIAVAAVIALGVLAMPITVLEDLAVDSGIAALVTAAQPPLGLTARLAAAFFAGAIGGGMIWFALTLLVGGRSIALGRKQAENDVPVLRRADAHPDAPARRPVLAGRDLGTPFLEIKAEPAASVEDRPLPLDLDTPMATYLSPFDSPLPAPPPVIASPAPLASASDPVVTPPITTFDPAIEAMLAPSRHFAPHERIETFVMPPADADPAAPLPQATIHDLLDRLERGVARRQPVAEPEPEPSREPSLEDTLDALRALARRVG